MQKHTYRAVKGIYWSHVLGAASIMFTGLYMWQPFCSPPWCEFKKRIGQHKINEVRLCYELAGLPGPSGLTRFTSGAAVPGKTPGKIYS